MIISLEERHISIIEELKNSKKRTVKQFAEQFSVTPETIRRDLAQLEDEGKLKRVHGGAMLKGKLTFEPPFQKKLQKAKKEKQIIGAIAASLVKDGDTIMIDCGTTTYQIVNGLQSKQNLTIITTSIALSHKICMIMDETNWQAKVIILSGHLNVSQQSLSGSLTIDQLEKFCVDKAFISCGGITTEGITDYDIEEARVSEKMIDKASKTYVLADSSKFYHQALAHIALLENISGIITNQPPDKEWVDFLKESSVQWIDYQKGIHYD